MTTSDNQVPRSLKRNQQILTVILWVATVVLGLLAIHVLIRGVDAQLLAYIFQRIQTEEMGPMTASTLSHAANLLTLLIAGVMWLGGVIFAGSATILIEWRNVVLNEFSPGPLGLSWCSF